MFRYAPRLVACEQPGSRPPSGLGLEIHVSQRLTVVVADDEASLVGFCYVPWRGKAARPILHGRESGGGGRCRQDREVGSAVRRLFSLGAAAMPCGYVRVGGSPRSSSIAALSQA
jgi:hypothetical protein